MAGDVVPTPAPEAGGRRNELAQIEQEARENLERANSRLWLHRFLGLGVGALLVSGALIGPLLSGRAQLIVGLTIAITATALGFAIAVSSRRQQVHTVERFTRRLRDLAQQLEAEIRVREAVEEKLRQQIRLDALTGALNHAAFMDELRARTAASRPFAVAMIDVDRMKFINDSYGHAIGDEVLTTVAATLGRDGTVVGRYGGDEFTAILPFERPEQAEQYRQGVLKRLAQSAVIDPETGSPVPVLASIGLAMWPQQGASPRELINAADADMYAQKRQRADLDQGDRRLLPDGEAARAIGELVPLLTAKMDLSKKFRLVAQRLAAVAGYDSVNVTVFNPIAGQPVRSTATFSTSNADLVEAWERERFREREQAHPIRALLERAQRPLLLLDPGCDERLTETERAIMKAAGIKSVLIVPMLWEGETLGMVAAASQRARAFTPRDTQFLSTVAAQITAIARMTILLDARETDRRAA